MVKDKLSEIQRLKQELLEIEEAAGRIDSDRRERRFRSSKLDEIQELKNELAGYDEQGNVRTTLDPSIVSSIQNDKALRFKQGFLDSKFSGKLLKEALGKRFPGKNVELDQLEDGNYTFSIDGSKPEFVDPNGLKDIIGEASEQFGRFVEPITDVGVGFATMNPLAAGASAAGFQTAREAMEAGLGEGFDPLDILGAGTGTALLGEAGNRVFKTGGSLIGSGARTASRKGAETGEKFLGDKLKNRAGQVLQEKATRDLEAFTQGVDPDVFARKFQKNLRNFVNTQEAEAGSFFTTGRNLAKTEANSFNTDITDIVDDLANRAELTSDTTLFDTAKKAIDKRIILSSKQIGKQLPLDETGKPIVNYANLSPYEIINIREGLVDVIKNNTGNPALNKIVNAKTALNDSLSQLAEQGSKSANYYSNGIETIKNMNKAFPERLRQKTLGVTNFDDYPSNIDSVTPKELLKKLKSNTAFNEDELELLLSPSGLANDKVMQREATQVIFKEALESSGGGKLKAPDIRFDKLSPEDIKIAQRLKSNRDITQAQKEGFSLNENVLLDSMNPENRLQEGDIYNFVATSKKLGKDEGGLGLAGEKLGGSFFEKALPMIDRANVYSQLAQDMSASTVEPGLVGAGANTIKQGFRPGLITQAAGDVGNIAGATTGAALGDIPKNLGNTFFTQMGKLNVPNSIDIPLPFNQSLNIDNLLQRMGTGLGAGSSVFINQRN